MIVDMHCHLDLYQDPDRVAEECNARGTYVLSVTTTPKAWHGTSRLSVGRSRIRTALGLHPQLVHMRKHEIELFDALLPEAKYVGEIGLDGGAGFKEHWDEQLIVFRHILKSVKRAGGRIMTIHSRASAATVIEELTRADGIPILHWFSGTPTQLKKAAEIGCWFSVGPAMLQSKKGIELVSRMPKERILTETDGPFGKYAGHQLFPWEAEGALVKLAEIWHCQLSDARDVVATNLKNLLSIPR